MPTSSTRHTARALLALGGLVAATALTVAVAPAASAAPQKDKLGKRDAELLNAASARGDKTVQLMLATTRGSGASAAARLTKLGATVRYTSTSVDYVRALVPTSKVRTAANASDVVAADVVETIQRVEPDVEDGEGTTSAGPGPSTPDANPYMPTAETGAVDFKKTAGRDGRGVTIGILDSGIDIGHPALQKTSTGEAKIVDWVSATDPLTDGDLTWFDLSAANRVVSGGTFILSASGQKRTYKAPAGTYRARMRLESVFGAPFDGDLNRDGDTTDAVAVLWDESAGTVRVDRDLDQDFTDETPMRDFKAARQSGELGTDDAATAIRESVPFVVQVDKKSKAVNLGVVTDSHGSHVAGITAAKGMFGGKMDGQAPGAKLVSVQVCLIGGGCTNNALVEGMIWVVEQAKVDVVNMSIGGLPALNDGNNVRAEVYNRLIRDKGVQIVISAGNSGPGVNTVGDPSVATDVISVAAGVSKATWKANYGADVSADQALFPFSSRGPREDGGLKPTVSAPGSAISTIPTWEPGSPVAEAGYDLPPGYAMFNGTSMSSPQTAGALALVIGAAKQAKIPFAPPSLRAALTSAATFNPLLASHEQGWGRIQVPATYALLAKMAQGSATKPLPTNAYTTSAPVCTEISDFLAVPDRGTGVYNRCAVEDGGQATGTAKSYSVTVSKATGGTAKHTVTLVGNDGTFSAPSSVVLAQGRSTALTLTATPTTDGVHSTLVVLDDPATPWKDAVVPATVISAPTLVAPSFSETTSGSVERNRSQQVFVDVPEGAPYLQVDLSGIAAGSQVRFIGNNPYGVPVESTSSRVCYTNRPVGEDCDPLTRTYAKPLPGIWEFTVESRRTSPLLINPFTLTTSVVGVAVAPSPQVVETTAVGAVNPLSWSLTNGYGAVAVKAEGADLGSALRERKTIGHEQAQRFTVEVPAGATQLRAVIGSPSDLGADLDLTVYQGGVVVGQDADGDSEEAVTIDNPTAGTYTVEVFGYDVPSGSTAYDYLDVFVSPSLGSVAATDTLTTRANGASWPVTGSVTALRAPAAGRLLLGQLLVRTGSGQVIGSGDVVVKAVTG